VLGRWGGHLPAEARWRRPAHWLKPICCVACFPAPSLLPSNLSFVCPCLCCLACRPASLPVTPERPACPGLPLALHCTALQAQVAVADVNNDGRLELVAADSRGNLAAFTADGKEVWERHLQSQIHQVGGMRWCVGWGCCCL